MEFLGSRTGRSESGKVWSQKEQHNVSGPTGLSQEILYEVSQAVRAVLAEWAIHWDGTCNARHKESHRMHENMLHAAVVQQYRHMDQLLAGHTESILTAIRLASPLLVTSTATRPPGQNFAHPTLELPGEPPTTTPAPVAERARAVEAKSIILDPLPEPLDAPRCGTDQQIGACGESESRGVRFVNVETADPVEASGGRGYVDRGQSANAGPDDNDLACANKPFPKQIGHDSSARSCLRPITSVVSESQQHLQKDYMARVHQVLTNSSRTDLNHTMSWLGDYDRSDYIDSFALGSFDIAGEKSAPISNNYVIDVIKSGRFDLLCSLFILLNALCVGINTHVIILDVRFENEAAASRKWLHVFYITFTVIFILEVLARAYAYGLRFFDGFERHWHIFDTILLVAAVVELSMGAGDANFTLLFRLVRIARVFRLVRVVRTLRAFRELRVIVFGIMKSARSLFWSILFLIIALYVFAMAFLQAIYSYLDSTERSETKYHDELMDYFGSLPKAMVSLFMSISGGVDWEIIFDSLSDIHVVYGLLFVLFQMVAVYGILNVVTGIFVESAMMTAKTDRHLVMQEEENQRKSYMVKMRQIFEKADRDNSGTLSWQEFERHLRDEHMLSYFARMGLDTSEAKNLFRILDVDDSNDINIDEFIIGCYRLKGGAKQLDLATLMYENKRTINRMARFMAYTVEEFEHVKSAIVVLNNHVGSQSGIVEEQMLSAALWPGADEKHQNSSPGLFPDRIKV